MDARERRILVVSSFGHFMSHFNMLVFPALLLPLAARMDMEMAEALGLSFWMYLLFGITALPWGLAADRWGARPLLLLFHAGAAASCVAAAWWVDSPLGLAAALAAIGCFSGIYHPTGIGWISRDVRRVSLGLAYNGMCGNLGLAAAPFLAGLVNYWSGPGVVYLILAGLNLAGAGLAVTAPREEKRHAAATRSEAGNGMLGAFLILLIAMMLGGVAYRGATVVLPAYFELKNVGIYQWVMGLAGNGLSPNVVATLVTSTIFVVGMVGQYTGGRMAERFELRWSYLAFHAIVVPTAFFMAVAADVPLVVLAMVYFFFLLGMQTIENTLVARFSPARFRHAAYGTKFILTFGVGALAVKMVGAVEVRLGIETVFTALGLVSVVLVASILLLIARTPRLGSA